MDVGCYCVNVSRLLLGEPRHVWATAVYERGVDVHLAGLLAFAAGAAAVFDCGLRAPYRQFVEVVGTEGTLTLARPFQPEEEPTALVHRRGDEAVGIPIAGTNQYTLMLDHFAAVVQDGVLPRFPPEDAVANMRVIDLLRDRAGSPSRDP